MRRDQTEITPTAEDHNSTITCVAEYREHVINSSVTLNVQFPPKIQRDSWCLVEGKLLVCVCTSRGNPLPPITWPLENLTDYSVRSLSSSQTVNSTFTLLAADYPNNTVKCISSNELAKEELEIPIGILTDSFRMTDSLDCSRTFDAALPWIAAVCFCLNVVLITTLVVYIYKHRKSKKRKDDKTTDIYASLRKTDDDQEYSVISPQHR
ncbi:sialic acid-binding Ig-like lectin 10 isoform X2 [Salarias fasciatus]|nr:sialic acid-binding Ig-like lectin 10 isoform X2 [Salarias fasciatus]XP_029952307.1 sialic acid-binding Ig-like lectin 10 isoform X2 [Salarias fasciatus]